MVWQGNEKCRDRRFCTMLKTLLIYVYICMLVCNTVTHNDAEILLCRRLLTTIKDLTDN